MYGEISLKMDPQAQTEKDNVGVFGDYTDLKEGQTASAQVNHR